MLFPRSLYWSYASWFHAKDNKSIMELVLTNLLLIVLGGCLGSFVSMLIYRLPLENSEITIFHPRSFCPLCKNQLKIVQLIPFIGYLFSRGTCRTCNAKISYSYLIHEILIAAFILLLFNKMEFIKICRMSYSFDR